MNIIHITIRLIFLTFRIHNFHLVNLIQISITLHVTNKQKFPPPRPTGRSPKFVGVHNDTASDHRR